MPMIARRVSWSPCESRADENATDSSPCCADEDDGDDCEDDEGGSFLSTRAT